MIGQHKRNFELVPYRSGWRDLFAQEAQLLQSVLGETALQIEHIGSTSIPGMAAKAIIDIVVAVPALTRSSELITSLDSFGYTYKPFDKIRERLFFAKEIQPEIRTHHLSLTEQGSSFWENHLLFRDYLRQNDELAAEYIDVKKGFADYYARTNHIDAEWKSDFVARVLELAQNTKSGLD